MARITIVDYYDEVDLRTVVARSRHLRKVASRHELSDGEAVLYTNKALTRFRMILKIGEAVFLCIPEIDDKTKLSVYLRISEELAKFARRDTRVELSLVRDRTQERISRRRKRMRKTA